MKVYIVNINNCEAYSDYHEGNQAVFSSMEKCRRWLKEKGFDLKTRRRKLPWSWVDIEHDDWLDEGLYDTEEYRIEEWEVD